MEAELNWQKEKTEKYVAKVCWRRKHFKEKKGFEKKPILSKIVT